MASQTPSAELILLRWMLASSVELSNVDLATCSNINRKWRKETKQAILEQALLASSSATALSLKSPLLLLPSMVYTMLLDQKVVKQDNNGIPNIGSVSVNTVSETFCAAWFASEGIQGIEISLKDESTNATASTRYYETYHNANASHSNSRLFCDVADTTQSPPKSAMANHNDNPKIPIQSNRMPPFTFMTSHGMVVLPGINNGHDETPPNNQVNSSSRSLVPVCYEWRGYSTALQVLQAFSYCRCFVNDVLSSAVALVNNNEDVSLLSSENGPPCSFPKEDGIAVRGATTARPENYCPCIDAKKAQVLFDLSSAAAAAKGSTNDHNQELTGNQLLQYFRRIEYVERNVCPRIIQPQHQQNGKSTTTTTAIQFLNAAQSHAVCMMTPLFDVPLQNTVITIFCVGIATEDGCFLSGLFHRLEVGHLYPQSPIHAVTELSSICIAYGEIEEEKKQQEPENCQSSKYNDNDDNERDSSCSSGSYHEESRTLPMTHHEDSADQVNNDTNSSTDDERLVSTSQCTCRFRGVCEKSNIANDGDDDEEEEDDDDNDGNKNDPSSGFIEPPFVHRGITGPGAWHCFTAVMDPFVDGRGTVIRVDGIQEYSSLSSSSPPEGSNTNPRVVLDGLTLGSDHNFGMSLCCGGMSDGSGQGAIAEVAVFSGRLPEPDIMAMEKHLMGKHGILAFQPPEADRYHERWDREAHALLEVDDMAIMNQDGGFEGHVPLRYLTRHRTMAWRQTDPVTGKMLQIKRIGSRLEGESSDF